MSAPALATTLKALHKPHSPLLLANVYDAPSARAVASLPHSAALATASYAIAAARGSTDAALDLDTAVAALPPIAAVATEFNKPLTVDIQDGYGDALERAIAAVVALGAAGVNLEDCDRAGRLYGAEEAAGRIRRALATAREAGVEDFVVNARCDVLVQGGEVEEVVRRGKQYLAAGATTVFVWGGGRGVSREEVRTLVEAFGGKLNVLLSTKPDGLTVPQLRELGVARISVGPYLQIVAMNALAKEAEKLLTA